MLDVSTGEVWTDIFVSSNEWNVYHDEDIISLSCYIREQTDEPLTMKLLKKYAEELVKEA